jgi:hypothetical protein
MERRIFKNVNRTAAAAAAVCLILFAVPVSAVYRIGSCTTDGGGGTSAGGPYIVEGTAGQPQVAGSSGGGYHLVGGFWPAEPACTVEFEDYGRFAAQWLAAGSGLAADLDGNRVVDTKDLDRFVAEWLYYCPFDWPLR